MQYHHRLFQQIHAKQVTLNEILSLNIEDAVINDDVVTTSPLFIGVYVGNVFLAAVF